MDSDSDDETVVEENRFHFFVPARPYSSARRADQFHNWFLTLFSEELSDPRRRDEYQTYLRLFHRLGFDDQPFFVRACDKILSFGKKECEWDVYRLLATYLQMRNGADKFVNAAKGLVNTDRDQWFMVRDIVCFSECEVSCFAHVGPGGCCQMDERDRWS